MNDIHQMPPDTAFLAGRVNENTPDHLAVKTGSANNVVAEQSYKNLTLRKLPGDGFRGKANELSAATRGTPANKGMGHI
ncbi:hypothetical protein PSEG_02395 [Pseudomonas sp. Nvir]|nr:hypothetical protein PSNVIR_04589 [Pseudomonas sp. Nvir]